MRTKHSVAIALVAAVLVAGIFWSWRFLRGLWPAIGPVVPAPSASPGPLGTASGWTSSLLADHLPGARDMALDSQGNLWVSQTSQGRVALIEMDSGENADRVSWPLKGLRKPHGLAFDPSEPSVLYVATETSILRVRTYSDAPVEKVADLPPGGRHYTRSLAFGSDGRLYVSIGSTCDVCREANPEHAAIISMNKDGSDRTVVATGLRNAVFLAARADTDELWATEMGRDFLGDSLPPDEVNVIRAGADYGWPICYGDRVHDTKFDTNVYVRDPCADTVPPEIALPAHVAPLGLAFLTNGDLLVAYHGSWNSTVPVGYKVVAWRKKGGTWSSSDFLTGFLADGKAIGRPVDVLQTPNRTVLVSDDKSGSIWKVRPVTR